MFPSTAPSIPAETIKNLRVTRNRRFFRPHCGYSEAEMKISSIIPVSAEKLPDCHVSD